MEELFISMFFMANILYCASYIVRDILWLRILTVVAGFFTFPYFYFQSEIQYSSIFWKIAFIVINVVNIVILIIERRPVRLTDEEKRLYLLLSRSFSPRELLKLVAIAEWKKAKQGEKIINKGVYLQELLLIFSGIVKVEVDGKTVAYIKDGGFAGEMSFASGETTSANIIAMEHTRYLCWKKDKLELFFHKYPHIKNIMWTLIGSDMASKLRRQSS